VAEQHTLLRQALPAAVSWDPEARQAVVIGSTDAPQADGVALVHTREAIRWPTRPLPGFVNHDAHPREFMGSVVAMELGREKGAAALICTVQLADNEAGRLAEPMVASGAARWSIRARIHRLEPGPAGSDYDRATDWEPVELSLVGVGMDAAAVTRSAESIQTTALEGQRTMKNQHQAEAPEAAPSAAEIRRAAELHRQVERAAAIAPEAIRDEVRRIAQSEGLEAARGFAIDAQAAEQSRTPGIARTWDPSVETAGSQQRALDNRHRSHWGSRDSGAPSQLAEAVQRAWEGKSAEPLWLTLRAMGHSGGNAVEVLRGAMSTSDLPLALTGSGNRQLLAQFAAAPEGVRVAATLRQLADYRDASTLDVGLVGKAQPIKEGGEIRFGSASEQAATYRPTRHGLGLSFTPESLANDDLAGLDRAIAELGAAMLEAEAVALAELLEGNALGALAPDGQRLFHTSHNNTVAGPLGIASLGDAVAKLRQQTTIGGRFLYQEPGAVLCAPGVELTVRQLLSDTLQAAEPANVNPWRNLEVAVDPHIGSQYVYLLPAGTRRPLELGRLSPAPVLESETDFSTGNYRVKSEHAFGCAVVDHRPIVRLTIAGS
jgi:hypothetical protein